MAPKSENNDELMGKRPEDMSPEELQKAILLIEYQTKTLTLAQTRKNLTDFEDVERKRREQNKRRMSELKSEREMRERIVSVCRHRSGGTPKNLLKGKGVGSFSLISRTLMPDGITILLQCPRCRMRIFTPQRPKPGSSKVVFEQYAKELDHYNKLLQDSIEDGLEFAELRGPTFTFLRDGVPFIPERI